ncbi:17026_t:CDS:2, partial [Funneliformis caledonium]
GQWRAVDGRGNGGQWVVGTVKGSEWWRRWRVIEGSGRKWEMLLEIFLTQIPNWVQPVSLRVHLVISDCI